jgi:hypothetical protein
MTCIAAPLLLSLATVAQVGPPEAGAPAYLPAIRSVADFEAVSIPAAGVIERTTKYLVPALDDPSLLPVFFQNVSRYRFHREFLAAEFADRFPALSNEEYLRLTERRATRQYFAGTLSRLKTASGTLYGFDIFTNVLSADELPAPDDARRVQRLLAAAFGLGAVYYAPPPASPARRAAETWGQVEFPLYLGALLESRFEAYTAGVGYGRVRVLTLAEFEALNRGGRIAWQDLLVLERAPSDIEGVVAGVITAEPQLPLSHVAIRTARRGTPNAFVEDALDAFAAHAGALVRLEVRCGGYSVAAAGLDEAEAWWETHRPHLDGVPGIDAAYIGLDDLPAIAALDPRADTDPVSRFGGKAVNLARLQRILTGPFEKYREPGFAIPLAHYLEFLESNRMRLDGGRELSYAEFLDELLRSSAFQSDPQARHAALASFREISERDGIVSRGLALRLAARIREVFGSTAVPVRFRSSSNVEDQLEFNGAGLYESTTACAADSFDADGTGPSRCDPQAEEERGIERALKQVWTSLWTFRAVEERAWYQVPQERAAMGVLVTRTFLDEAANGVAFTGNPANSRDRRFVINVQKGEISVVSPPLGIQAEKDLLEVDAAGAVTRIVRSQRSSLAADGEYLLTDSTLRELGAVLRHIQVEFPVALGGRDRSQVLFDIEFKLSRDGALAIKQVRPFLFEAIGAPGPEFELVVPPDTVACGVFADGRSPADELAVKSQIRFRSGSFRLPVDSGSFEADLIEDFDFGPERERLATGGPGRFEVALPDGSACTSKYSFAYRQSFRRQNGEAITLELLYLDFEIEDGEPARTRHVLDEAFLTDGLILIARPEGDLDRQITFSSCRYDTLPLWDVRAELADGASLRLEERFRDNPAGSGPANLMAATIADQGGESRIADYWRLVYAAQHHNVDVRYWIVLDPPRRVGGVDAVHVIALDEPQLRPPRPARAAYLGADLGVVAEPVVRSYWKGPWGESPPGGFRRGDADASGGVNLSDAVVILRHLYQGGAAPSCPDAADFNDEGVVDLTDAVLILSYLFRGADVGMPPGPDACGPDPSEDLLGACSDPSCSGGPR